MTDLFTALYEYWVTTTLNSLMTALYNTEAPETAEYPYAVMSIVSNVADWTFTEDIENCLVQFNIYSDTVDATEVCNIFEALKTAFDFYDLSISNYETISLTRENAILTRVEKVWTYNATYRILLGKN